MTVHRRVSFFIINIIVIIFAVYLFLTEYKYDMQLKPFEVLILIAAVIIVHIIKALRLYLAMYGENISLFQYMKVYFKVTPVSVLLPYKAGEIFRMYCYGDEINNGLKGIILVLLDRFMDTIALVTVLLLCGLLGGGHLTVIAYILVIFIVTILSVYLLFPGVYGFWKKYFLRAAATPGKLNALRFLKNADHIYQEIKGVTKGRGMLLYFLSLIAWGIEIGSLAFRCDGNVIGDSLTEYLSSAIGIGTSEYLRQFVVCSVILLTAMYVFAKLVEFFGRLKK